MQLLCSESLIHRGLARAAAFSTVEGGAATFAFRAFKTGELQPPSWDISEHLGRAWGGKIRPVRQRSVERRRRPASSGRPPVAASRDRWKCPRRPSTITEFPLYYIGELEGLESYLRFPHALIF